MHRSLTSLFKWFKVNFNNRSTFPVHQTPTASTPSVRTPGGQSSYIGSASTPLDPQAIQRATANLPQSVFSNAQAVLAQVAGQQTGQQTPQFTGSTSGAYSGGAQSSMAQPYGNSRGYYGQNSQTTPMQSMSTPNMTNARNYSAATPGSMPPPQHIPSQRPGSRSGAQWSNLAQDMNRDWKKPKVRTPAYNTPGASSQMSISPTHNTPNLRGDQTPVMDEWGS